MSRKGNCRDNAVAESFFGSLKKERSKKHIYKNREIAVADISDYIESFYNRTRRHSHLSGMSPEQFEAAFKRRPDAPVILGTPGSSKKHADFLCMGGISNCASAPSCRPRRRLRRSSADSSLFHSCSSLRADGSGGGGRTAGAVDGGSTGKGLQRGDDYQANEGVECRRWGPAAPAHRRHELR